MPKSLGMTAEYKNTSSALFVPSLCNRCAQKWPLTYIASYWGVECFPLEHFSILIHHWPAMEMLSLSILSLLLSLCFMLLRVHSADKVQAVRKIHSTTQGALSTKRDLE